MFTENNHEREQKNNKKKKLQKAFLGLFEFQTQIRQEVLSCSFQMNKQAVITYAITVLFKTLQDRPSCSY